MNELRELYQEVILDHNRRPRNFGSLPGSTHSGDGFNPLCGDRVCVRLIIPGDVIEDVRFEGSGCAISIASASLMTECVKGRTIEEADVLFNRFHQMVTGEISEDFPAELEPLCGVREFPVRIKCATLPWHAMQSAIHGQGFATTEGGSVR